MSFFLIFSYVFMLFMKADQRCFFHQPCHCNILFLLLEENILCALFWPCYQYMMKQKVYLLLGNLDQLYHLNIVFVLDLILLIDSYSSYLCLWILIWFVVVVLYYLQLVKLLLEYSILYRLLQRLWLCLLCNWHKLLTK